MKKIIYTIMVLSIVFISVPWAVYAESPPTKNVSGGIQNMPSMPSMAAM